jgi:hypothetical protein
MDYLGEVDQATLNALSELNADEDMFQPARTLQSHPRKFSKTARRPRISPVYLLRLDGPLYSPWQVASIANLPRLPRVEIGISAEGSANFCRIDQNAVSLVEAWAFTNHSHRCTKIRSNMAHKDVCPPILGRDPTMPQYRPDAVVNTVFEDCQLYPIRYFFYGTLADPKILTRVLNLPPDKDAPLLIPGEISDGRLRTWGGKYNALIDEPGSTVTGWTCMVDDEAQEEALRMYETDAYEVVECAIRLQGAVQGVVQGYTFHWAGYEDELDR